ncbi:cytochrome c biogenesis protein DipZ [uncultured Legionella sp.]|uniref:cytochrome c biogenesis protein DipZ n=1 Tax=uncultured Legionella sp. TaxID=210934 RepID=UPI00261A6E37|nr:cytochrome c biogenesis protein DipZ [uncultured Legionella sp.]
MMNTEIITLFFGFLEGFALILSPCILSILPVILAGSLTGSKTRSFGIIIGFIITFSAFAYFARQLVQFSGVDLNLLRYLAYGLLLVLAVVLLSDYLTERFSQLTQKIAAAGSYYARISLNNNGLCSGLFIGALVALIWTPCAGPILAAVIVQIAIQQTTILSFLTLLAFTLGAALPMFIITLYGFKIRDSLIFFKTHSSFIRRILGLIIGGNIIYMISLEAGLIPSTVITQSGIRTANYLERGLWRPYDAPEIEGIKHWLNSPPLQLSDLKNKVILIDFWTYSCINCVRTIPYLNRWYKNYHDKGLVIIGIHTPEFDFEKKVMNVARAVKNYGIEYPVALDNSFTTWQNYSNYFWPAHYLINKQGKVVYEHFGEGEYDVTENNIRFLLQLNKSQLPSESKHLLTDNIITPETYLGFARAENKSSPELIHDQPVDYSFSDKLNTNAWSLHGLWLVSAEKIKAMSGNSSLKIHFNAKSVFVVMGNNSIKPISVKMLFNGKPIEMNKGRDVSNSSVLVDKYALYEVLAFPKQTNGILHINPEAPGLELFTFTFGN